MELHYTVAAQTDVGIFKDVNQDSMTVKVADTPYGEVAFAVICDGMGGLDQGEVASALVVRAFEEWFINEFPVMLNKGMTAKDLHDIWNDMINDCNLRIMAYGNENKKPMGTTLTAMLFVGNMYYICHVGDCRIYSMGGQPGHEFVQLTTDHTFVEREVSLGHMTPLQAQNDIRRNVLLQCVGTSPDVNPDFLMGEVEAGASYILCSDGFRHELQPQEMYDYCYAALNGIVWRVADRAENTNLMNKQLRQLININIERGEKDNISAILIKTAHS